jgi:hypothetical protein
VVALETRHQLHPHKAITAELQQTVALSTMPFITVVAVAVRVQREPIDSEAIAQVAQVALARLLPFQVQVFITLAAAVLQMLVLVELVAVVMLILLEQSILVVVAVRITVTPVMVVQVLL